jgi:hypothetical protein
MGMTAMGAATVAETLSFGNHSQRGFQAEFRGVDDYVFGLLAFDFFIPGIQLPTGIDDGTLERLAVCLGKSG